jgi:hypothetical protein
MRRNSMKKIFALGLVIAALACLAALAPAVVRASGDAKGPACVDISGPPDAAGFPTAGARVSYLGTGTLRDQPPYTFSAQLLLGADGAASGCKNITYTLYIVTDSGLNPIPLVGTIDDQGQVVIAAGGIAVSDDDPDICIYATTSRGSRILDRAPDSGCLDLHAGASGGLAGFS